MTATSWEQDEIFIQTRAALGFAKSRFRGTWRGTFFMLAIRLRRQPEMQSRAVLLSSAILETRNAAVQLTPTYAVLWLSNGVKYH